jgi:hypothetical protein
VDPMDQIEDIGVRAYEARVTLEVELETLIAERIAVFNEKTGCRVRLLRSWMSYQAGQDEAGGQGRIGVRIATEL